MAKVVQSAVQLVQRAPAAAQILKSAGQDLYIVSKPVIKRVSALAAKELGPPKPSQWGEIKKGLGGMVKSAQKMEFLQTPVKDAIPNVLLGVEVMCWFYVGEIIGKGSLIGYNV